MSKEKTDPIVLNKIEKLINVSKSGHGIVHYRLYGSRRSLKEQFIEHTLDGEGSEYGSSLILGPLEEAFDRWLKRGNVELYESHAFSLERIGETKGALVWHELPPKELFLRFIVDLQGSFGDKRDFAYEYAWAERYMFSHFCNGYEMASSLRIAYTTGSLRVQLSAARDYPFKQNPLLVRIDVDGKEELVGDLCCKERSTMATAVANIDDTKYFHYVIDIPCPEKGSMYRVKWVKKGYL